MNIFYAIFLLCISWNAFAQNPMQRFSWLEGTWQRVNKNSFEIWHKEGDALAGSSFKVQGVDTVMLETTTLTFEAGVYYYTADVAGGQRPVAFRLTTVNENGFVAENPAHDFPKVIRYRRYGKNEKVFLEASIEGEGKSIPYSFIKIN